MKVGFVVEQVVAPVPGGTGRYSAELAAALARRAGAGDTVTGWCGWRRNVTAAAVSGVRGPRRLPLPARGLAAAWAVVPGPRPAAPTSSTRRRCSSRRAGAGRSSSPCTTPFRGPIRRR